MADPTKTRMRDSSGRFMASGLSDEEKASLKRERQRLATQRWRDRHPERNRAYQQREDAKPERKARKRMQARKLRQSDAYKALRREYLSRPEVRARVSELNQQPARRKYQREWRRLPENRRKRAAYMRSVRATAFGTLKNRMSVALRRGLVNGKGGRSWEEMVGYAVEDLRQHLEKQFLKGMSWENMSEWHIDHIIPLSQFNFSSSDDADFKAAWALPNLRPLWGSDNIEKRDRVVTLL